MRSVAHLGEDAVMIYPVAGRDLLTDADLTSKERMVLGRWAGDGLIEVVPQVGDRVPEVADISGLPVVTRDGYPGLEGRYPWLRGQSDRVLRFRPGEGGARIIGGYPGTGPAGRARVGPALAGVAVPAPRLPDLRRAAVRQPGGAADARRGAVLPAPRRAADQRRYPAAGGRDGAAGRRHRCGTGSWSGPAGRSRSAGPRTTRTG